MTCKVFMAVRLQSMGGTLPEVTVTASKDKFYNHLTALMLNGDSMEAIYLFSGHYSTKANIQ